MTDFTAAHIAYGSPLNCAHGSEVPSVCPCSPSCYCKGQTCRPKDSEQYICRRCGATNHISMFCGCRTRNGETPDPLTESVRANTEAQRIEKFHARAELDAGEAVVAAARPALDRAFPPGSQEPLPLPPFYDNATCPKCGGQQVTTHWRAPGTLDDWREQSKPERLKRTCERCGYSWDERPLDAGVSA